MQDQKALDANPKMTGADSRQSTLQSAVALHQRGKLVEAKELYARILLETPDHFDVLHLSGLIAYQCRQFGEAEQFFIRAMGVKSDFAPLYSNYGAALNEQKRYAEALAICDRAITVQPDLSEAFFNRAIALRKLDRFEEALADLDRVISLHPAHARALSQRAEVFVSLDRMDEAIEDYKSTLVLQPAYPAGYKRFAYVLQVRRRYGEAIAVYDKAIALNLMDAQMYYNRGLALQASGRSGEALESYDKAISLNPRDHSSFFNKGNALKSLMRLEDAVSSYDAGIAINPDFYEAHVNKGVALHDLRRFVEALRSFDHAILLKPDKPDILNNRGVTLRELGRFEEAIACFDAAIAMAGDYAQALNNRGNALKDLRRFDEALASFEKAIAVQPDYAEAYNNKGNLLKDAARLNGALASYDQAISLRPDYAEAHSNRGNVFRSLRRFDEALASYEKAILLQPRHPEALNNRANTLKDLRRFDEALASYQKAIEAEPRFFYAHSNLLFTLNYLEKVSVDARVQEARRFGVNAARQTKDKFCSWKSGAPVGKLRIGFVSGDFRAHPVGYFLESVLSSLDQSRFELIAYSSNDVCDDITMRLKEKFVSYKSLVGKFDAECARLIHDDGVQILIDLSGHTAFNRLLVFAFKPAPVQVSWLGYFATTGVAEMDYILGDPWVTPVGEEHHFTEKIKRLPETYFCFTPPVHEIAIDDLPALKNGYVTFGCFNNFSKINESVISLWAQVLLAVEGSRLFLKAGQLDDARTVRETIALFETLGVSSDRLMLEGQTSRLDNFKAYNKVDIALDPFPYPGGTTSVEGLWMGVPVITKKGNCFVSHNGETIAHNSGQSDWIACDEHDYLGKAVRFSADLQSLAKLRNGLRRQVLAAPLFDAPRFARHFEEAMFEISADYQANGART